MLHLHCASDVTGKGRVARDPADPPTFDVEGLSLQRAFRKHHPSGRFVDEHAYARLLTGRIARHRPDVVISANTPLLAQARAQRFCRRRGIGFVFWQQDILSIGMGNVVSREHRWAGAVDGPRAARRRAPRAARKRRRRPGERGLPTPPRPLAGAARPGRRHPQLVADRRGGPAAARQPVGDRARLRRARVALYCGTLGRKHDPALLWALAERAAQRGAWEVVVVAEGHGAEWLRAQQAATPNPRLHIHGYQAYADLPDVLGTADVLVALLEPDAGVFSVPSKVLTYHCAGRAMVAAVPAQNLSARLVPEAGSGRVVAPGDTTGFVNACEGLLADPATARRMGRNARLYAERNFPIEGIVDRFALAIARSLGAGVTR